MSTNEHKLHIFHLFCILINSKFLYYVTLKKYINQAHLRPYSNASTNFTDIPGIYSISVGLLFAILTMIL